MKLTKRIAWIILGNLVYALTVQLFLSPSGLITGGSTGLSLFLSRLTGFSTSTFVFVINVCMFLLAWVFLSKDFVFSTLISTFVFPLELWICEQLFQGVQLTNNLLLNSIYSGLGIGLALAIVLRQGASTGGMDIPPLILRKFLNIPVGMSMYIFDALILGTQLTIVTPEMFLYGLLVVLLYTLTLDRLLVLGNARTEVKIICQHSQLLQQQILEKLDRGVTILEGRGGYSGQEQEILLTVLSNRELPRLEKLVHEIDPSAFMVISRVSQVQGRGFTSQKVYPPKPTHRTDKDISAD